MISMKQRSLQGLMVVNHFLKSTKFNEIYKYCWESATQNGIELNIATNADLIHYALDYSKLINKYDFVLFWDKDIILANQLEMNGLRLFNSANAIADSDDKSLTFLRLKKAGLPIPKTIIAPKTFANIGYTDSEFMQDVIAQLGLPIVMKECFGSFGMQVYTFDNEQSLVDKVEELAGTPLLFQEMVKSSYGRDIRINVVGESVIASMLRTNKNGDFRSNITLGGSMEKYSPTDEEKNLAILATKAMGLDFAGVDILFGENGPIVCEVNSNPHFATTLACTGVNMANEMMAYIKGKCL